MNTLTIAHTSIQQDEHGRYSLNDLYRASGSLPKNRPTRWMRNSQTQALIDELISEAKIGPSGAKFGPAPVFVEPTKNPATYVVKELVYAYAMWISPAFTLKVIRAYDALMRGETAAEKRKSLAAWRAHLKKYPQDGRIRDMAEQGEPYWFIGLMVKLAAATVGKRIKRMIEWGFMDEARLRSIRSSASPIRQLRRKRFGQLSFKW